MAIKKIVCSAWGLALLMSVIAAQPVSAHWLIKDQAGKTGAIIHFSPDDSLEAGRTMGVFYQIDTKDDLASMPAKIRVRNKNGTYDEAYKPTVQDNNMLASGFTLPNKGVYEAVLTLQTADRQLVFTYDFIVLKDTAKVLPESKVPVWAKVGLLLGVWAVCAVAVLAYRTR